MSRFLDVYDRRSRYQYDLYYDEDYMSSLNKVILIGNVGKEPEIKNFGEGKAMASFSMATSSSWKDKNTGENKVQTEWHRVVSFSSPLCAIIQKYVKKGTKLYIEGSIQTRDYQDNSGVQKKITQIVLTEYGGRLILLNKITEDTYEEKESSAPPPSSKTNFDPVDLDDEIPF